MDEGSAQINSERCKSNESEQIPAKIEEMRRDEAQDQIAEVADLVTVVGTANAATASGLGVDLP